MSAQYTENYQVAVANIKELSRKELLSLQKELEVQIERRKTKDKIELQKRIMEIAYNEYGISSNEDIIEVLNKSSKSPKPVEVSEKLPPKYRFDKYEWTGRGKMPVPFREGMIGLQYDPENPDDVEKFKQRYEI